MNECYIYLQEQGEESSGGQLSGHTCVCAVEIESYPRQVLLQRQRDGILPWFPIWDDINTFDGKPWRRKGRHRLRRISLPRTFPQLEKELESRANALGGFGERWPGWLAKYDQDLSLWKTPQCSLLEDYIEFSETWPKWGMMRDGGVLGADDTGAPHRRKRIWILAYTKHWKG